MNEEKNYKVRNTEGKYLSFNFNFRTGEQTPLWGGIAMSYPFTLEEGRRLASLFGADLVPESEWAAESKAALEKIFGRKR